MSTNQKIIKVLVVDDSLFMRTLISNILEEDGRILVLGMAKDGYEAIEKVHSLKPDVVTLDLDMPRLDGLSALGYIMSECPTPVIVVSGIIGDNTESTMQALDYGAVDFIVKPTGPISLNMRTVKDELIKKILTAAEVDLTKLPFLMSRKEAKPVEPIPKPVAADFPLVIIGASTGGPRAVSTYVMQHLPKVAFAGSFVIVQHMPAGFTSHFAQRLNKVTPLKIREVRENDVLTVGHAYVAQAGRHLVIKREQNQLMAVFDDGPKEHGVRPALNVTLRSVAKLNLDRVLCVILTGMGSDGAAGCKAIKQIGAHVIVQDESTSVVFGMPGAAYNTGCVDEMAPLEDIPKLMGKVLAEI